MERRGCQRSEDISAAAAQALSQSNVQEGRAAELMQLSHERKQKTVRQNAESIWGSRIN